MAYRIASAAHLRAGDRPRNQLRRGSCELSRANRPCRPPDNRPRGATARTRFSLIHYWNCRYSRPSALPNRRSRRLERRQHRAAVYPRDEVADVLAAQRRDQLVHLGVASALPGSFGVTGPALASSTPCDERTSAVGKLAGCMNGRRWVVAPLSSARFQTTPFAYGRAGIFSPRCTAGRSIPRCSHSPTRR
jgi:hypothetical protein